jgi:sigma-B regulation protein RsbU (phosphoserine phosphatase)
VPPILVSGKTGEYRELTEGGMVIGLFPQAEYKRGIVMMQPGDVFVACTDGIEEAADPAHEDDEFGTERLAACVARNRHRPAHEIVAAVMGEVNAFCRGAKADDKVLMVVKVNGNGVYTQATSHTPHPPS